MSQPSGEENLVTWARPLLVNKEGLEQLVDPALAGTYNFDDMAKVAAIASMCVHQEVSHIPFMGEVVQALKLIYNDADETCGDYCSQKDSLVPNSADFKGDLAPSDSSLWNLTPRLRYGQASSFITMEYSSGPLEDMVNRPHSASSIPREGSPDSLTICSVPSTSASPGEVIAEIPSNPQSKPAKFQYSYRTILSITDGRWYYNMNFLTTSRITETRTREGITETRTRKRNQRDEEKQRESHRQGEGRGIRETRKSKGNHIDKEKEEDHREKVKDMDYKVRMFKAKLAVCSMNV
ncbi:PREDICTED: receptor-like serine/threonine-protein kinase ALE2 [Camelina sativa]|uniref:Receptor-like serine/threonine-protein kinase ALE2 n=1 Tax=Camelina sativa TaxID=90675 RepID=A0ABM1RBW8_CAMSA|nr:PREDICTED: receptor-like serine/threonine-protein kinase ALE2 [Camelina sativa]